MASRSAHQVASPITQAREGFTLSSLPTEARLPADEQLLSHQSVCRDPEATKLEWLCCFGCSLVLASSWGFMQSVGSTQSAIAEAYLQTYSTRDVGWISGIYIFLGLFLGVQAGPLIDLYGPGPLAPIMILLTAALYFLLAECTRYWHFMLCLGLLGGMQAAIGGTIGIACIGKLFVQRKGLAMGLALSGSSLGGVIYPILLRKLLQSQGFKEAFRVIGTMATGLIIVGTICLMPFPKLHKSQRMSVPAAATTRHTASGTINFTPFRSLPFTYIVVGTVMLEFAIIGISGLLPTFAGTAGFSDGVRYNLVALLNGCSCFGRILPGIVADRLGHFDIIILMIVTTALITGVLFLPFGADSVSVMYAFAALWGFGSGSWLSIMPVCVGKTCEPREYGRYYGVLNWAVSFAGLISIPVGGEMLDSTSAVAASGLYLGAVVFGGVCFIVSRRYVFGKRLVIITGI